MRVAYVIPTYPPTPLQPFVVNEMVEVQDAGHDVVLVPLHPGPPATVRHGTFARLRPSLVLPAAIVNARIVGAALATVLRHPLRVLGVLAGLHRAAGTNPYAHARLLAVVPKALAAARWLPQAGVDRIHAHFATATAELAAIAGTIAGLPYSFTAHAYDIYSQRPRVRNDTIAWKVRHAQQVFTVSRYGAALMRRHLPPSAHERVHTVYVGIPTDLFHPEPLPPRDGPLRLLAAARFCEKKGLDTLIDACAILRDRGVAFHLKIFGDGELRPALAAQIERLGLTTLVTLGQPIPQEEMAREMRACHLFVMPCRQDRTGDMDGIPTVFMEAMASGRPVVSCAVSGIPELVQDGETGLIVPPNDARALAAAVERIAGDEALHHALAARGRTLVERQHDQRRSARRLLELMGAAAAPAPAVPPAVATG